MVHDLALSVQLQYNCSTAVGNFLAGSVQLNFQATVELRESKCIVAFAMQYTDLNVLHQ